MPLSPGARLGVYEVTAKIGEGGMGEVYRARDSKLNRDVALKVLPDLFASDPDRLARFEREAQLLAALNHPNIGAIYGLEETAGTLALALELIEGPTLADRIAQGPIPVDEAVAIARQIADALEAAHEQGIIHRDLKPANVKLKDDGAVKVLDFGLAKALEGETGGDPSQSPTLTAAATQAGVIMGTAAYMAPEQAKGKVADKRADIWSFGIVLLEMLTGQRVFAGETISETLADVMKTEPSWDGLPADLPSKLGNLLRRCLQKDPRQRVRDIGDVRLAMEGAFETTVAAPAEAAVAPQLQIWQRPIPAVSVAFALVAITSLTMWALMPSPVLPVSRLSVSAPPSAPVVPALNSNDVAISPDGSFVVYRWGQNPTGTGQLFVRMTNQIEAAPLRGPTNPFGPFVSPDGAWVGFVEGSDAALQKVSTFGGPPVTICALPAQLRGASWGDDDTIVFGTASGSGLLQVSAAGGEPEAISTVDGGRHVWPDVLPGGAGVLFTVDTGPGAEDNQIALLNLDTGEHEVIIPSGTHPRYMWTGHIVYGVAGTLRAVPFDLDSLEVTGDPVPVVEGVAIKGSGAGSFDVSQSGSLVYIAGAAAETATNTLVWVDRDGREEPIELAPGGLFWARVSPDGTHVAFHAAGEDGTDVWVSDLTRPGTRIRVTTDAAEDGFPLWTPDGDAVVFQSDREGEPRLFRKRADGTGVAEELLAVEGATFLYPYEWSRDGEILLVATNMPETGNDFGALSMQDESSWQPLVQTEAREGNPSISPDGQWVAYRSHETGDSEVYVARLPTLEDRQPVSVGGGYSPVWSGDGRELFYQAGNRLMTVPITTEPTLTLGAPELLFEGTYLSSLARSYDVSPDGRFLMVRPGDITASDAEDPTHVVLVQNWSQELAERVPVP